MLTCSSVRGSQYIQGAALVLWNRSSRSFTGGSSGLSEKNKMETMSNRVKMGANEIRKHFTRFSFSPFFSTFFSLLLPLSLRLRSRDRDLLVLSFRSSLPKSFTLSRSHSRSERVLSLLSIALSLSAHWSFTAETPPSRSRSRSFSFS